ncbi:hypothetical protein Nocox_31820 [Nonomuraea coxensis DSM 45129]|uniref:Tetracycline repressor TetR C-terminal domain-containing protein n=2 Tax=Nonomuraea coxensis TaxID=404386 RepID=A0ABX8U841_9ACTN|nr:TetR/AcrR family transcriptional regulator C-terminal domain-containing protein [Nonomuraea coxensis]QYC43941.1 hypothetical protein Nocox_31820 [Nonomuraea coxensis DSM 45129]
MTGYMVREAQERSAPRREGVSDAEPPHLAPLLERGVPGADDNFERGLRRLLDGIERELPR